jgi:hypothetical protein
VDGLTGGGALDKRLPGQALAGSLSVHHGAPRLVVEDVPTPDAAPLRVPVA